MNRRAQLASIAAAAVLLVVAGCGDDDDASGDEDYQAFCPAFLAAEAAGSSGDPEAMEEAFTALGEATPEEAKATLERTLAAFEELMASEEEGPSEEFDAAYAEMITIVKDKCGFDELTVTAADYSFSGAEDAGTGPTIVTFENQGSEFHEFALMRKNDGVTTPILDVLELGEEEASEQVTFVGAAFAPPGGTGYTVFDLEAGNYAAICFIPVGATPEAFESGEEPDGPPHFTHGMVVEFEVS